ncbi:dynein axonemal light chain 1-like [Lineus longissimus]|uniref:dynein axonemal light chain 1-like n=1 Tax=Lineus longissimus TaxID=88925 RepID=UPI002B4D3217
MSKGTTIKEALAKWEDKEKRKAADSTEVKLLAQIPPIEKMDASLSTLVNCRQLSLSTNTIEKIANLNGLKNLKILSLARNSIKSLTGLEAVGDTLEELWISYNNIEKLKGINMLKNLKVLYIANNSVKDWGEFQRLEALLKLDDLLFVGNPLEEKLTSEATYRDDVIKKLKMIKKLDGVPVVRDEPEDEQD